MALADGSVRSYFALPPDYDDFAPLLRPMDPAGRFHQEMPRPGFGFDRHFGPMGPEFLDRDRDDIFNRNPDNTLKRKYGDEGTEGNDDLARQRQQLLQYGNAGSNSHGYSLGRGEFVVGTSSPMVRGGEMRAAKNMRLDGGYEGGRGNVGPLRHNEVDQEALKKAFLYFAKLVNENPAQRNNYLADGKQGPVQCIACGRCSYVQYYSGTLRLALLLNDRSSQAFPDTHGLVMHAYNSDSAELHVDHLGLHKALCILMRWNYLMPPDNSKAYQILSADEAAANQDDLIMWPPMVIIHNTVTGKGRDARIEGLGNKAMDNKLRDLGFGGGKAKSLYGREGHLGITLVKFAGDQSGLKEALRLAEFFEKENHGRSRWAAVQSLTSGKDEESNPNLVKVDKKTGERERIFYGYLGTVLDLEKVDFETRKKLVIESARDYKPSK
ncbi:hypothetical protein RJ639_001272 [Escallonia herrerae]|uniref:XS domain-containing protein n=1 Tax=Escallonia herrerae TaxID=1293975 RepID=A0AA89BMI9_9ASTE|nr:hypothetical protein RJ639_001272 [Escallonia herrerae]